MKRKLLSLVLVAAMLVSMVVFAPTAGATESLATLELGDAVGAPGEKVTVDLTVTTASLSGIQFMFEYDTSRLTYGGTSWTTAYPNPSDPTQTGFAADLTNGAAAIFTATGPYRVPSWATAQNVGAIDLSAGVTLATLNFTIKEDAPAGDAYVRFVPLADGAVQPNKIETGSASIIAESMTFVDGKVTVIPADYATESTLPPVHVISQDDIDNEDVEYEYNEDEDGVIITGYTKGLYEGVVVIPSTIEDTVIGDVGGELPVVGIGFKAFNGDTAAVAFVIPESVVSIEMAAFFKCTAADYYVLNSDCEIGEGALGATGTCTSSRGWKNTSGVATGPYVMVIDEEEETVPTIHAAAGTPAAVYAAATYLPNPDFEEVTAFNYSATLELPSECKLTFAGNSYYVAEGATVTVPGTSIIDGKTVVAWTDGTNTYAAGSAITLTGDVALEPITITAPETATTVDFKLTAAEADLAMRFTSTLAIADYNALASLGTVELGMMITPAAYVAKAGSFTKEALDALGAENGAYVDIAIDGYYNVTDTDYIFAGSLKGFSAKTLEKNPDFAAILYATITTESGDTFTVYGDFNFAANQNIKSVADTLSTSSALTDTQKGWLTTLVGKFTA